MDADCVEDVYCIKLCNEDRVVYGVYNCVEESQGYCVCLREVCGVVDISIHGVGGGDEERYQLFVGDQGKRVRGEQRAVAPMAKVVTFEGIGMDGAGAEVCGDAATCDAALRRVGRVEADGVAVGREGGGVGRVLCDGEGAGVVCVVVAGFLLME